MLRGYVALAIIWFGTECIHKRFIPELRACLSTLLFNSGSHQLFQKDFSDLYCLYCLGTIFKFGGQDGSRLEEASRCAWQVMASYCYWTLRRIRWCSLRVCSSRSTMFLITHRHRYDTGTISGILANKYWMEHCMFNVNSKSPL